MRIKKTDPARHIKEQLLEEMNQLNQSLETVHSILKMCPIRI